MLYRFAPVTDSHCPASRRGGPVAMRSGGVYDVDPEWAAAIIASVPGVGEAPSLVSVAGHSPASATDTAPAASVAAPATLPGSVAQPSIESGPLLALASASPVDSLASDDASPSLASSAFSSGLADAAADVQATPIPPPAKRRRGQ